MKQIFAISAIAGLALTFSISGCGKDSMSSRAGSLTLSKGYSIYISDYVDGDINAAFIFKSALEAEQEQEFSPPLTVNESSQLVSVIQAHRAIPCGANVPACMTRKP